MTENRAAPGEPPVVSVVCPFCALGCDDLEVVVERTAIRVVSPALDEACRQGFERPLGDPTPRVDGRPASLEAAVARAAEILGAARLPALAGLATDTDGVRAALALAERVGGFVDHAGALPLLANVQAMQSGGWVTATLAEVRLRADLVVLFGTDAAALMPRLYERVIWSRPLPPDGVADRRVVLLGQDLDATVARSPEGRAADTIVCPGDRLMEVAAILRALVEGRVPAGHSDLPLAALAALAADLGKARYGVIAWAVGAFPAADAELTVATLAELLKSLNARTRAVGLPLVGPGNALGANQVTAWSWGVPLRTSVASASPDYDPHAWSADGAGQPGGADALLWIDSFGAHPPPATGVPAIALVRPGTELTAEPAVVIPVGTPGLDHRGVVFRTDTVVALPLRGLRTSGLPTAAAVLDAIRARLGEGGPC